MKRWQGHDELVVRWMRAVAADDRCDATQKLVAFALGLLVVGKYRATHYPDQPAIAHAAGLGVRTVRRASHALERRGWIRTRPLGVGQGWKRKIYRLRSAV